MSDRHRRSVLARRCLKRLDTAAAGSAQLSEQAWWKDAEILMLRHQLAVALRERPRAYSRLTWPDRAWLALIAGVSCWTGP